MREAHDLGWTWSEIAAFAGYENATVARNQATARGSRPPPAHPPGTHSVREAAERLGVTPQTIYNWIDAGRLEIADGSARGTRVFLPSDPSSAGESE
ncbi:hypothetical protein ASC77_18625 [Nocardioides sp. Root1257]|nr:hypothetical protein ASC77_18625 [Nocardioides sp. Root1257]KRC43196.1 hypothetical protein ASE24_19590 [Nocardioides sp. Root224]